MAPKYSEDPIVREHLKSLAGRLLGLQEEEQGRIARELHDEFNQKLAALTIGLESLERDLPRLPVADVREKLRVMGDAVRTMSDGVHELARRIHPSMVELLGLAPALKALCSSVSRRDGMEIRFTHRQVPLGLPTAVAICLYRVAQEALHNVERHSGAPAAAVTLAGVRGGITLKIRDRGIGFDPSEAKTGNGLGLISMEGRVRSVGGELTIRSKPADGTEISVTVPLATQP